MKICENDLSFLPVASSCTSSNFLRKVENSIEQIGSENMTDFQKTVICFIREHLTFLEYNYFRKSLISLTNKELDFAQLTILKLLQAPYDIIESSLLRISQNTEFYPSIEKKYIAKEKRFEITPRKINVLDCYSLIQTFISQFKRILQNQVARIIESEPLENFETLYRSVFEIFENGNREQQDLFLVEFHLQYGFLKDTLYCDLYENVEKEYGSLFLEMLKSEYRQRVSKINQKKDLELYHYCADSRVLKKIHPPKAGGVLKTYQKRGK